MATIDCGSTIGHAFIDVRARNLWHDDIVGEGSTVYEWHHVFATGEVFVTFTDGRKVIYHAEDVVRVLRREPWLTILERWAS